MCERREQVLDYLYDEGPVEIRREVQQHLQSCDECRDEVRGLRSVRDDLLAWAVPHPPSVWTPFAAAPVVPWYRQVPGWAMAAAATLMMMAGASGVFAAYALGGRGTDAAATTRVESTPARALDAQTIKAIEALVRESVASAGVGATPAASAPAASPVAFRLDPAAEQRLFDKATQLVGGSEDRQWALIQQYLSAIGVEADRERRGVGQDLTALKNRVDQLQSIVGQLVINQTKVQ